MEGNEGLPGDTSGSEIDKRLGRVDNYRLQIGHASSSETGGGIGARGGYTRGNEGTSNRNVQEWSTPGKVEQSTGPATGGEPVQDENRIIKGMAQPMATPEQNDISPELGGRSRSQARQNETAEGQQSVRIENSRPRKFMSASTESYIAGEPVSISTNPIPENRRISGQPYRDTPEPWPQLTPDELAKEKEEMERTKKQIQEEQSTSGESEGKTWKKAREEQLDPRKGDRFDDPEAWPGR